MANKYMKECLDPLVTKKVNITKETLSQPWRMSYFKM